MRRPSLAEWAERLPLLNELAQAGAPVIVGCSGGADSLALLALTVDAGIPVVAVHVDHGLRDGSEADYAIVEGAAGERGVASTMCRIAIEPGPNLEARARSARYEALEAARVAEGASAVLVGHTLDDQAETVLLNLLRGSATAGLSAMAARHGSVARPMLGLRHRDTLEICARLGFAPVVDPMNSDPRYRRVWLRREVLPALEAGADRDLRGLLARQAEVMREESDFLDALAREALAEAGDPPRVERLAALEPALARRALRLWLGGLPPTLAAIDSVLAVVAGERQAVELPGGRRIVRSRGALTIERADDDERRSDACEFALPGAAAALGVELETWIESAAPVVWPDGRETCVVDADIVGDHAWLRPAEAGERFAPLGLRGTKLVVSVAHHARVVATSASGGVVWVVGYRIDDHARVTSRTRRFLWMTVSAPVPAR
jgi:tRNA(Ile)-lysidine synthase